MSHRGSKECGIDVDLDECECSCANCVDAYLSDDDIAEYMSHSDADPGL